MIVAIVVAIAVISSAILIDEHIAATHHRPPHIGILSLSEIDHLAGQLLRIYGRNNCSQLKKATIIEEIVALNTWNHTSSVNSSTPGIILISGEFTNLALSLLSYNVSYMTVR